MLIRSKVNRCLLELESKPRDPMIDGCKASDGGDFAMVMEDGSKK